MPQVVVILGSRSDRPKFEDSGFLGVLNAMGISYEVSIISAHRNPGELEEYCLNRYLDGALVFVGIAGMAAALPGAIAAQVPDRPVIGVPLPSDGFPDGRDALLAMYRMPPGKPVAVCGLANAGLLVAQLIGISNEEVRELLNDYLEQNQRKPEIGIISSERSE